MEELLLISPVDLTKGTIIGGNVDIDKYGYIIFNTQIDTIEPLLGTELYDKILQDKDDNALTGIYQVIYDEYVYPILKNAACANTVKLLPFKVDNGGIFKHTSETGEVASNTDVDKIQQVFNAAAQKYIMRFRKFMCKNVVPEYKTIQDEVNAIRDIQLTGGWKLDNVSSKYNGYNCDDLEC